jgi:hypothetical protein
MGSANKKTIAASKPRGDRILMLDLPRLSSVVVALFASGCFVNIPEAPFLAENQRAFLCGGR